MATKKKQLTWADVVGQAFGGKVPTSFDIPKQNKDDPYGFAFGPQRDVASTPAAPNYTKADVVLSDSDKRKNSLLSHNAPVTPSDETMPKTRGEPVVALAMQNIWMPMAEVNKKVAKITDAHIQETGVSPSPGLVRDLLLADQVITRAGVDYRGMFSRPNMTSQRYHELQREELMKQAKYLGEHGFDHPAGFPGVEPDDWDTTGLLNTSAPPGSPYYAQVEEYNKKVVAASKSSPEGIAGWLGGAPLRLLNPKHLADLLSVRSFLQDVGAPDFIVNTLGQVDVINPAQLLNASPLAMGGGDVKKLASPTDKLGIPIEDVAQQSGLTPLIMDVGERTGISPIVAASVDYMSGKLGRPYRDVAGGFTQIRDSLLDTPQGLVLAANAVALDAYDWHKGEFVPHRSVGIVKGAFEQIHQDILHPEERMGYLSMDVFAALSIGAGTAARVGAGISRGAELAASRDFARIPKGQTAFYRPAEAAAIDMGGGLQGHQYFHTVEEAWQASPTGQVVRITRPTEEALAYQGFPAEGTVGGEPPVAAGQVRLYRGEGAATREVPAESTTGRYFTDSLEDAQAHAAGQEGGAVFYVDVPAESVRAVPTGGGTNEFLVSREAAIGKQPLSDVPALPESGHPGELIFKADLPATEVAMPGAIGRAARITGAAARQALKRPVGGSGTFDIGEDPSGTAPTSVIVPYFDNTLARQIQKGYLKIQGKRLKARQLDGEYLFGNEFLDQLFAPEKIYRRGQAWQGDLNVMLQLVPALALQRMERWDNFGQQIFQSVLAVPQMKPMLFSLTHPERVGIQQAIILLGSDSVDAIVHHRVFHERQIEVNQQSLQDLLEAGPGKKDPGRYQAEQNALKGTIAAHEAKLKTLDLAADAVLSNNPKLQRLYEQAIRVAMIRNQYQRAVWGMDDRTMDQAVARTTHHLLGSDVGWNPQIGAHVRPAGIERWEEAEALVEQRTQALADLEAEKEQVYIRIGQRGRRQMTDAQEAHIDRINEGLALGDEQLAEAQQALEALGPKPDLIPITRTVIGEREAANEAIKILNLSQQALPNLDVQRAITFLQQGELPSNVAQYLGDLRDRWENGGYTQSEPTEAVANAVADAIDVLGGVPIENLLYGAARETRTPHGQMRQEFRALEQEVNRARLEGRDPEALAIWPQWEALNERLGLDPRAVGTLLPEEPAQIEAWMRMAGEQMVKSRQQAQALAREGRAALDDMDATVADPQETLTRYRDLEQQVEDAQNRVDALAPEDMVSDEEFFLTSGDIIPVGSLDWELWARNKGFTGDEIASMRDWIDLNESMGLAPWHDNYRAPGEFTGDMLGDTGFGDEEILNSLRDSRPTTDTYGGVPIAEARQYAQWQIDEAEAFLAGNTEAAQAARLNQIAYDSRSDVGMAAQGLAEGGSPVASPLTHVSDEELTRLAREVTTTPKERAATEALNKMRTEAGAGSFQIPQRREIYREKNTRLNRVIHRLTPTGFRPPRSPDSHRHRTGAAMDFGDVRLDVSNLLLEQWGDVLRLGEQLDLHRSLFRHQDEGGPAVDEKLGPRYKPIRDLRNAPRRLTEAMATLERLDQVSAKDLAQARKTMESFADWMYPEESQVMQIIKEGGNVRWVDEGLITEKPLGLNVNTWRSIDTGLGNLLSVPNEAWRQMLLFSSPAYALNALGSAALLLTKQGFLAPVNYGRALTSRHIYGEEVTRILDAMAGTTHTMSYMPFSEKNLFTALTSLSTQAWQHVTDTHFRRAAVIHELRRRGLLKDNLSPQEMSDQLRSADPAVRKLVVEATAAARNGMLNFNKMSWPERAIMRHLFFIYSFMRASAAYTLHYIFEHPAQHAALSAVGRERENLIKKLVGDNLPQWFYDQGWIPIGPGEVINPSQINMPATLNQLSNPVYGLFSNQPYSDASSLLGGGTTAFFELITGRSSQTGEKFKTGRIQGTVMDMWSQSPWGRAQEREKQRGERQTPLKPGVRAATTNPIDAAMASEKDAVNLPTTEIHSFWDTYGRGLMRTAKSVHPNVAALQAREWKQRRESDPEAYAQHERDQVQALVTRQEGVVGQVAPPEVRAAVDFVSQYVQHMNAWREGKVKGIQPPKHPNSRQEAYETIRWMREQNLMSDQDFRVRMANIRNPALSQSEIERERLGSLWNLGGKPWKAWNTRVQAIDFFAHEGYGVALERLKSDGIGDYTGSAKRTQAEAWQYGRAALRYTNQLSAMRNAAAALTGDEKTAALDQIRVFENEHSEPVTIGGKEFPPLALAAGQDQYARLTEPERKRWLVTRDLRSWGGLSSMEKWVLTGSRPDPAVQEGWAFLHKEIADYRATLPEGKKLPAGTTKYYGDALAKQNAAFKADWENAHAPLAQRMLDFKSIQNSSYSKEWKQMLQGAATWASASYKQGWKPGPLATQWKQHLPELQAWVARQDPGFRAEVQTYIDATPTFLTRLVKP